MTSAPHEDIPAGPRVPLRALKRRRGPSPAAGTHRQQHRNGKPGRGDALGPVAAGWHDPEGRLGTRDPFLPLTCAGTRLQTRRPLAGLGSAGSGSVQLLLSLFNKPAWREARPHAAVLLIANRLPWPSRGPGTGRRGQRPSVRPSVCPPTHPWQTDGRGAGTERTALALVSGAFIQRYLQTPRPGRSVQAPQTAATQTPTNRGEKQTAATARAPRGRGGAGSRSSARDKAHGRQRGVSAPVPRPVPGRGPAPPSCKAARDGAKTGAPGTEPSPKSAGVGQP